MSQRRAFILPLVVLACLPMLTATAQEAPSGARTPVLENIVVTASRTVLDAARVGSSMTVIDHAQLEDGHYRFVADALREVAGLAVSRGGGQGAVTQVRIRGAEGNHTLVLIDGIEANNPVANSEFDFANLAVTEIERIEILRGPQSALYGSDAIGGVINVITRQPAAGLRSAVEVEAGQQGTQAATVSLSHGDADQALGLAFSSIGADGQNVSRFGTEADGFRSRTLALNASREIAAGVRLGATLRHIDSEQSFDAQDFSYPPTPTEGLVVDADLDGRLRQWFLRSQAEFGRSAWQHRAGLSMTDTRNQFFEDSFMTGQNAGRKIKLDWQSSRTLQDESLLTLAAELESVSYENQGATPLAPENQSQRDRQTSAIVEYQTRWYGSDLVASARYDANQLFDDSATYRLTWNREIATHMRVRSSLGTGIANPGFFELFGYFPDSFLGNPELRPERSRSFDIGIDLDLAQERITLDASYFHARLEDEIETVFDSASALATVVNVAGTSKRSGWEFGAVARVARALELSASYTYTDSAQADGREELRRPSQVASLAAALHIAADRGLIRLSVLHTGDQQDAEFRSSTETDRVTLPGYNVARLSAQMQLTDQWRIHARIENLLDAEYEEWFSYRSPGRMAVLGVSYQARP
jgi:vitamin B12 transporter